MIDRYDVLAIVGLVSIGIGLWLVTPALSLVVVGALLMLLGILGAARQPAPKERKEG